MIELGISNASRASSNYYVGFAGAGGVAGKIQGTANGVAYTTSGADYAEYFKADAAHLPQPGDIVSISGPRSVRLAQGTGPPLVGVISTSPGFIGNGPICAKSDATCDATYAKDNVLVALSGQVPTKVSTKNGVINPGDPIGPSDIPGMAQKATSGMIVGYALEAARADGSILVLVRPGNYNPAAGTSLQGGGDANVANLTVNNQVTSASLAVAGNATVGSLVVSKDATFKGNVAVSGTINVNNITVNGHISASGSPPKVTPLDAIGKNGKVAIAGNDTAGTITLSSDIFKGIKPQAGGLAHVEFTTPFTNSPQIILTPANADAAKLQYYYDTSKASVKGFDISTNTPPASNTTYVYSYFIIQGAQAKP